MSNIHGLSHKKVEKKANEEEYSQGAAGQSGTAVWRPNNSGARGPSASPMAGVDPMADILAQARASVDVDNQTQRDAVQTRIQSSLMDARAVHFCLCSSNSNQASDEGADRNIGLITLYANGFIIGNGEFRDIKDPKNKTFLEQLKKGEVPDELEGTFRKEWGEAGAARVNLVDKSTETFTPPKPKFDFAKSQGQSLGSSTASSSASVTAASFADATPKRLVVDASQPTTTLQLVLADRKRLKETANQSSTVMDVYQHIMSVTGLSGFELVAGFPPKPLTNPSLTLKDAGLLNGSITQRG